MFHVKDGGQNFLKCPWKGVHKRTVGKGTIAGFGIGSNPFTPASRMQVLLHVQKAVKWPRTQKAALINLEMVKHKKILSICDQGQLCSDNSKYSAKH